MPLLAPLLELVQLQELAPLLQAQLLVRAFHLRIPRLRFELLQAMVAVSQRVLMPLLAPLLELVQLQDLAPLVQAQLQVRAFLLRIP